ncbi:MarR family transcriptional regulator [Parasphingorhabdus sp.]|jgi:DNA-binding MarR family transcriptional regulator|uniref:MarR family winged helix-turn-helix transcriptional regulator n=1 Tax=Parasphingorhabdus sp. TaxID=2709688 RepID=UPI0030B2C3FA|nr:MarR family transcriptional regulator [Sphingomonadales bacterium]
MSNSNALLVALRQINRAIDLQSKKLEKDTGQTTPQLMLLKALEKDGRAKPSVLAKSVHLSHATVTSIVDRLEKSAMVTREKNVDDRRSVEIVLTEKGRECIQNAPEMLQEDFLLSLSKLEPWEQNLLISSVQRIAVMMDASQLESAPLLEVGEI